MNITDKVRAILDLRHWNQSKLAESFGTSQSTVNRWLNGAEPEGHRRDQINDLYAKEFGANAGGNEAIVPLVGYIGAGAEILPEFEQVPPEGLDQITIPFLLPDEMLAFQVKGESMLPVYRDGTVIVCYREQKRPLEAFYGLDAAVKTSDGRRFLKTIARGVTGVNLLSFNAAMIEGVHLDWIGEIFAVLPQRPLPVAAKMSEINRRRNQKIA